MYQPDKLIDYIERRFDALTLYSPTAMIIVTGDFNTLNSDDIVSRTGMLSIVNQPARGPVLTKSLSTGCPMTVLKLQIQRSRATTRL